MLPDGRRAVPVFQLIAERYLDAAYAPDAVAERCGIPAATIRRIAAEIAEVAFGNAIELAVPWTDWAGRRHETMRGPAGRDACDARHLGPFERLSDLPRAASAADAARHDRCAGRLALQVAVSRSRARPGRNRPASPTRSAAGDAVAGHAARLSDAPEDLLVDGDGRPGRIDKAFSWEAPIAAHGLMHMVIANAGDGRSLPDRHAVHVHGQHGVELVDEHRRDDAHADRQGSGDRRVRDPAHHLFRRLLFRDGRLRRSGPARHDLSRTLGLHLAARPADRRRRRAGRRDPPAGRDARPRRAAVPGRADRSRRAAGPAGLRQRRRQRRAIPAATPITSSTTSARPAIGPLAGWRGADGERAGTRRAEPESARTLHRQRLLLEHRAAAGAALLQARQQRLSRNRGERWA